MITVITVLKSGGEYTREYACNLRRNVAQHMETDHRFICLTDTVRETEFDEDAGVQWEPLKHNWPGWWSKVEVFRPDLEQYGRFLFIDLSCIPIGNLDEMAAYDGPACVTSDWYHGGPSQSVLSFAPGAMREVWDLFNSDPEHWMKEGDKRIPPNFGDQILVNEVFGLDGMDRWQDLYPGQLVSFKVHCKAGVPNGARLVKFHGHPRIHECEEPWVNAAWKVGFRRQELFSGVNTGPQTLLDQVRINSENGTPWVMRPSRMGKKPKKDLCIVGGGPSLKGELDGLRLRKRLGHTIWATNGAHDYLIDNKIVPDALVIMDARPDNVQFLKRPHKRVEYLLASRVHPSLFAALEGHKVTLWHSYDEGVPEFLAETYNDKPWAAVTGGSTVGLRCLVLGEILEFKFFHMYGFDSSYSAEENHAFEQSMNNGELVQDVFVAGETFRAAPWMVRQVINFQDQARIMHQKGLKVSVHGDGLLPFVAKKMNEGLDFASGADCDNVSGGSIH